MRNIFVLSNIIHLLHYPVVPPRNHQKDFESYAEADVIHLKHEIRLISKLNLLSFDFPPYTYRTDSNTRLYSISSLTHIQAYF